MHKIPISLLCTVIFVFPTMPCLRLFDANMILRFYDAIYTFHFTSLHRHFYVIVCMPAARFCTADVRFFKNIIFILMQSQNIFSLLPISCLNFQFHFSLISLLCFCFCTMIPNLYLIAKTNVIALDSISRPHFY